MEPKSMKEALSLLQIERTRNAKLTKCLQQARSHSEGSAQIMHQEQDRRMLEEICSEFVTFTAFLENLVQEMEVNLAKFEKRQPTDRLSMLGRLTPGVGNRQQRATTAHELAVAHPWHSHPISRTHKPTPPPHPPSAYKVAKPAAKGAKNTTWVREKFPKKLAKRKINDTVWTKPNF